MNLDIFREYVIKNPSKEIAKCKILDNYSALLKERSHKCNFEIRDGGSKVLSVDMGSLKLEYSENLDLIKIALKELGNQDLPMLIDLDYLNMLVDGVVKDHDVNKIESDDKTIYYSHDNGRIVIMRGDTLIGLFVTGYIESIELSERILDIKSTSTHNIEDGITRIDLDTFEVVTLARPWSTRRSSRIVSPFAPYYLDAYELARRIYGDDDDDDDDDDKY